MQVQSVPGNGHFGIIQGEFFFYYLIMWPLKCVDSAIFWGNNTTVINVYWLRTWIYSFGFQVFTVYTVKFNTDFENIIKKICIFEVSIHFYCIKCEYLVPKWIDSYAKSVYIDDSEHLSWKQLNRHNFWPSKGKNIWKKMPACEYKCSVLGCQNVVLAQCPLTIVFFCYSFIMKSVL